MRILLFALLGLVGGAIVGGVIGVGAGLAWTTVFQTSCFEGYCAMLVFFAFLPGGAAIGAIVGAAVLGSMAARRARQNVA
jgi:ABC-type cobalt transport system substrate-binding protein